jgi:uncharacterized protein
VPPAAWLTIGYVTLGAALGGFVEGAAELEFPLVALALWAWLLPPQLAAPLAVFGALLGAVVGLFPLRGGFDLKRMAPLVVAGALAVPLGVFLLHNADPSRFRLAIGALLTLNGISALAIRDAARVRAGGISADAIVGVVGGVLGGLCGLAAPPPAIWTQMRGWKREPRRVTIKTFTIVVALLSLAADARTGVVQPDDLRLFAVVAPAALVASILGARLVDKSGSQTLGRIALLLTLASGVALLVGVGRGLWGR